MADDGPDRFRRRLVGAFALATMEREGPIHGYRLAERVAERTEGAWRPGPGAVYPALQRLVRQGLARSAPEGRRRVYRITASGRALLRGIRAREGPGAGAGPDPAALWAEVRGIDDLNEFYLQRLRRDITRIEGRLSGPDRTDLRDRFALELRQALDRLAPVTSVRTSGRR